MDWKGRLLKDVSNELSKHTHSHIKQIDLKTLGVHLAVFSEPFLSAILSLEKSIESRFSKNRISPFKKVVAGDLIIMKESGGPVIGCFVAGKVEFRYNLTEKSFSELETQYGQKLCSHLSSTFWEDRLGANYATLIGVHEVWKLPPLRVQKRDRMAWTVLKERHQEIDLFEKS